MVKIVCRYLFSSSTNKEADLRDHLEKGSKFEQQERIYAITWGGGGRARGQKSLQKHLYCIFLYLQEIVSTPLSLLCASKAATEL